jgi:hypothetical protein
MLVESFDDVDDLFVNCWIELPYICKGLIFIMLDPIIFNKAIEKACYYDDRFFDVINCDNAFSFSLCYVKECKSMAMV